MAVILKRPLAKIDLADIWDYIAEDNESRADAFIDAIDRKFHVPAEQPPWVEPVTNWQKG